MVSSFTHSQCLFFSTEVKSFLYSWNGLLMIVLMLCVTDGLCLSVIDENACISLARCCWGFRSASCSIICRCRIRHIFGDRNKFQCRLHPGLILQYQVANVEVAKKLNLGCFLTGIAISSTWSWGWWHVPYGSSLRRNFGFELYSLWGETNLFAATACIVTIDPLNRPMTVVIRKLYLLINTLAHRYFCVGTNGRVP